MKSRSSNFVSRTGLSSNEGMFIPLFAFSLISLLLVVGLAVDAGRLFLCQRWAQRAADAGAYAGGAMVATRNPFTLNWPLSRGRIPSPGFEGFGILVEQVVRSNLRLRNVAPALNASVDQFSLRGLVGADGGEASALNSSGGGRDVTITVTPLNGLPGRPETVAIDVKVKLRAQFFILPILPGFQRFQDVEASARTEVDPGIVSIMVDTSASMMAVATPGGPTQIDLLKQSLSQFVQLFDPARDNVSLTGFGTAAQELSGFTTSGGDEGGFDLAAINASIGSLAAGGSTNYSDALIHSYVQAGKLRSAKPNFYDRAEMSYVVFGDGSATASRLFLTSPQAALPQNSFSDPVTGLSANYDYLVWTGGMAPSAPSVPFRLVRYGPGVLSSLSLDTQVPTLIPACSRRAAGAPYEGLTAFASCLTDFTFSFGAAPSATYTGDLATRAYPVRPTRTGWFDNAERLGQMSAIVWADTLRSSPRLTDGSDRRAAFSVIGLGADQPGTCFAPDSPWNDEQAACAGFRNDRFLSRLAYDEQQMSVFIQGREFPGVARSTDRAFLSPGTYRRAVMANELIQRFLETAFQIKLQLVR